MRDVREIEKLFKKLVGNDVKVRIVAEQDHALPRYVLLVGEVLTAETVIQFRLPALRGQGVADHDRPAQ
jgi:hypothetical protein